MMQWEGKDVECGVLDAVTFLKVEGVLDWVEDEDGESVFLGAVNFLRVGVEDGDGDWGHKHSCGDGGRWEQLRRDGQGTPYTLNKWMQDDWTVEHKWRQGRTTMVDGWKQSGK